MTPRRHRFAFTLLELVLVLVIISTVMAITMPNLRGWSEGAKLRDAATEFAGVAKYAAYHAATTSKIVRLHVRIQGDQRPSYWLTAHDGPQGSMVEDKDFADVIHSLAHGDLPEDFRMELAVQNQSGRDFVEFYPTGRVELATVKIISPQGEEILLECAAPTEGFRIKDK